MAGKLTQKRLLVFDAMADFRQVARLDWPMPVTLLLGTLSEEEWDRLEALARTWPADEFVAAAVGVRCGRVWWR